MNTTGTRQDISESDESETNELQVDLLYESGEEQE